MKEKEQLVKYSTMINTPSRRPKRKCSHGVDWQQKGLRCGPAKLDNNCFKMYKISDKVRKFITEAMKKWKMESIEEGKTLTEVKN